MTLPSTWREVRLSEVCEINPRLISGDKPPDDEIVTFLPMSAVDEVFGEILRPEQKAYKEVSKGFTPFKEGDVLFAKITPSMENGKAAVARGLINGIGFGSTEFHVLRPIEHLLSEYLFYFIRMPAFRHWAKASFVGTAGQQRVPSQFLERVPIPLPSLPEQLRIVEILKQVDDLLHQRLQIIEQAKQLPILLFLEMFGNPDPRLNQRWDIGVLGKTTQVETGGTPRRERPEFYQGELPWVKSTELIDGRISKTEETISEFALERSNTKLFPPGTVLLAMYGQGQTRGRTGLLEIEATCNQACAAILPNGELLPCYVLVWLQCSYNRIRALGRGGQQANINLDIVRSLKIPKPPINIQKEFCETLTLLEKIQDELKCSNDQHEKLLNQTVLLAFSGRLTSEWRRAHRNELETWLREQADRLPKKPAHISFVETAPHERPAPSRHTRRWLMDQLGEVQAQVYEALREWKGTLIPSEDLDSLLEEWPVEQLEDAQDHVLRSLEQLAGLGLIAKVSVANQASEYVSGFRMLRDEELSHTEDIDAFNVDKE